MWHTVRSASLPRPRDTCVASLTGTCRHIARCLLLVRDSTESLKKALGLSLKQGTQKKVVCSFRRCFVPLDKGFWLWLKSNWV